MVVTVMSAGQLGEESLKQNWHKLLWENKSVMSLYIGELTHMYLLWLIRNIKLYNEASIAT